MDFSFVFWFFVREEIKLDKWIREASGPVRGREVAALNYLHKNCVSMKNVCPLII